MVRPLHIIILMFLVASIAGAVATSAAAGGGGWLLGVGDMIKKFKPISAEKLRSLRKFQSDKCTEAEEGMKREIHGEIDRISEETGGQLRRVKDETQSEIDDLRNPEHVLNRLCKDLGGRLMKVEEICRRIDGLPW